MRDSVHPGEQSLRDRLLFTVDMAKRIVWVIARAGNSSGPGATAAARPRRFSSAIAGRALRLCGSNGDKLEVVLENSVLDITTSLSTGDFRFVEGTGRFADASGKARYVVAQDLAIGEFQLTAVGRITY